MYLELAFFFNPGIFCALFVQYSIEILFIKQIASKSLSLSLSLSYQMQTVFPKLIPSF